MLRTPRKLLHGTQLKLWQNARHQSQAGGSQRKSGGGTVAIAAATGVTAGLLGVIGYAAWSEENRKVVNDNVPGMQYVTDTLLGPVPVVRKATAPPLVPPPMPKIISKPPAQAPSKLAKESTDKQQPSHLEIDKEKSEVKLEKQDLPAPAPAPPLTVTSTPDAAVATKIEVSALGTDPSLRDVMRDTSRAVTAALDAAERAAEVVQQQALAAIQSVDSPGLEKAMKDSISAALNTAETAFKLAEKGVTELATGIACSKSAGQLDDLVTSAEQAISELAPAVVKIKSVIGDSLHTIMSVEMLCGALKEAREKLSADLQEVLPMTSKLDPEKKLKLMLGHAYIKMSTLQMQINEKQKVLEEYRARGLPGDGSGGVTESVLQSELDKLRHQLQLQHRSDLGRQQEELEAEVRGQLKRQAAAHGEHLSDMLTKQSHDINADWQVKLYDEIVKEKDRHYKDIATIRGRLLGLQSAVTARADADRAAHSARKLWLACQGLRNALRLGREGANTWDEQLQPLKGHLDAVTTAAAGSDEFVSSIVGSVGDVAVERGVYTEEALRHRFNRVATVARRVAMVPENGGSLLMYLLSYVQSVLLIQVSASPSDEELLDQPFNIHNLSTFDIIDRARTCLAADDLLGGVRWLNQLTGESRRVASDWCIEARRTLEMRQAVDALMAHAAATTATAL